MKTANNDRPDTEINVPLLVLDMWEHAYFLDYQNDKRQYINNLWQVINWKVVEQRYLAALG
jgi:Fe-Mn family superoxide dismutase